jgi:hypothetical protein
VREDGRIPANGLGALEREKLPPVSSVSERLVLYESVPGPGGSRYDPRADFPLGS